MTYFNGNWTFTIHTDALTVKATRSFGGGRKSFYHYQAKTLKQAWYAYFNPFKVDNFIPNGTF